jgi:hypothetical protein
MHLRLSRAAVAALVLTAVCSALPAVDTWSQTTATTPKSDLDKQAERAKRREARKSDSEAKKKMSKVLKSGDVDARGAYQMGPDELAMDCKRLTGAIKINISHLRDARGRKDSSDVAQSAHKTVGGLIGGSTAGADRQAMLSRDRAKLDAYNAQLEAKKCKQVDIDAELARVQEPMKKY